MAQIEPQNTTEHAPAWTQSDLQGDPHAAQEKGRRVQRMFGAIAQRYDLNNRLHSFWQDQRWRRRGARLAGPTEGADVVDVACGTGDLSEVFHDLGAKQVTGVDFTPEMLQIARQRADRSGRSKVEYVQGDAMGLDLPDECADIVSIAFGLRNVEDPSVALAEFRRVLRPGGRLLVLEFSEPKNPLLRFANRVYTRGVLPVTASLLSGDRSGAYHYLPRSIETFYSRDAIKDAVLEAGFEQVQEVPMCFGVCVAYLGSGLRVR